MSMMRVKIISNLYQQSTNLEEKLRHKLQFKGIGVIETPPYDIVICVGGDGTLIHALNETKFNTFPIYTGINSGGLGFLQKFEIDEVNELVRCILKYEASNCSRIRMVQENMLSTKYFLEIDAAREDKSHLRIDALNEIIIYGADDTKIEFSIYSNGVKLNTGFISADKVIFSTPTGSTGHIKSYGGPVICEELPIIISQLIGPICNRRTGGFLTNPLISSDFTVILKNYMENLKINIDGKPQAAPDIKEIKLKISGSVLTFFNLGSKEEKMKALFLGDEK